MIIKMSTFKFNIKSYYKLYQLLHEFCHSENVSADEFIELKLMTTESFHLTEEEIEKFVLLITHKNFLEAIKTNIVDYYKLRNYKDLRLIMIVFVILFASEQIEAKELFQVFKEIKCAFKNKILQYFFRDDNLVQTALTGSKFFEDDYVTNQIINPLLNRKELFKKVDELLFKDKAKKRASKPTTVPIHISALYRPKPIPAVPLNTPAEIPAFQAKEVPKSLYQADKIEKKIIGEFEKNRQKAQKLLAQAKSLDKNFCKPKKPIIVEEPPRVEFKAKKAPSKNNVQIKGNVAATLREASRCIKEQEEDIKQIENLLKGGGVLDKFKAIEEGVRELKHQKSLEDIERKHLEGLLTFEEAILAKRKLVECNKEKFRDFMEEREVYLKQIDDWREAEQAKIKEMAKRCQEIKRNAKESEKRLKEEKKSQVTQIKIERQKMKDEYYEKQQEELAKKVKLIEEIKTLHQLRSLHPNKEFNPNDCPNLGLLCQMSIADLQKKLHEVKLKMEEQLEQKRKCIQKYREKQRKMIENVKNFITQTRMSKPKRSVVPIRPTKCVHTPELDQLRSRLEHAREERSKKTPDDVSCKFKKYQAFMNL